MKLEFIALDKLIISKSNMRYARKAPDVSDILPSIRQRGVLQPVIVRPVADTDADTGQFEILAGARRFTAALIAAEERRAGGGEAEPHDGMLPCAIIAAGDDAAAVEASLIENMARLDPDEVTQWESFTRLVKEGRTVDDIAATFGLPELAIKRILALGNLLPRIRALYAKDELDSATVRHLTLASKSQQKAWLALFDDPDTYCPTGHQLKAWLFGGQSIPTGHALFDVAASGLATIADLFGEDSYFADAEAFWAAQNAALAARRTALLEEGWADVIVVPPSEHFSSWEYERAAKRKGGRVYLDVRASGEVVVHEGYVSRREAMRLAKSEAGTGQIKPVRPEVTATMQTYLDLHRHAAVRAALTDHPGVGLRLLVAHAIAGSPLWGVRVEPQSTRNSDIRVSVAESKAEAAFEERRRAVLGALCFDEDTPNVLGGDFADGRDGSVVGVFQRLLDLPDRLVMEVATIVIGETLASGSAAVAVVGLHLGVNMADYWQADDAFFSLIRDKAVLTRIVAEVAGETVATANASGKTAVMKQIVRDRLAGENGRERLDGWVPRWLAFPPSAYTERGGGGAVAHTDAVTVPGDEPSRAAIQRTGDDGPGTVSEVAADGEPAEEGAEPLPLAA